MIDSAPKLALTLPATPSRRSHVRQSIRRLGNFSQAIALTLKQFNRRYGVELRVARPRLVRAFLEWARQFEEQKALADRDRRDFSHFAAGLMLGSLIRNRPVESGGEVPARERSANPEDMLVGYWPEGVFYFEFCITVLDQVLAEQSLDGVEIVPEFLTLRSWHSFRENVSSNPNLAVPFLDLFLGGDPVWDFPTAARFRKALQTGLSTDAPARHLS